MKKNFINVITVAFSIIFLELISQGIILTKEKKYSLFFKFFFNSNLLDSDRAYLEYKIKWDYIFSSIGTTIPISKFFDVKFKDWKNSININFICQLEIIHELYKIRSKKKNSIILMAGGGTNNPFTNYSAYCVSKIALIKMSELIDDEYKNINIFIIGPGFTKTKTHFETIAAGKKAGKNFLRVKKFLNSSETGTSYSKIFEAINWGINQGRKIVGGRNFSVVHDKWGNKSLSKKLYNDIDMFKLRRYKN